jgi:hypothetical protein
MKFEICIKKKPFPDYVIGYDDQYSMDCVISIPEEATIFEATHAWFKALEVAGYAAKSIDTLRNNMMKEID